MKYQLLQNSRRGILIERTPILQEDKGTFMVSFLLPDNSDYVAVFDGPENKELVRLIKNNETIIPRELIMGDTYIGLRVCKLENGKIAKNYDCGSLHVKPFLELARTQWELSDGLTDQGVILRMAELEKAYDKLVGDLKNARTDAAQAAVCADKQQEAINALNDNQRILQENIKWLAETVEHMK